MVDAVTRELHVWVRHQDSALSTVPLQEESKGKGGKNGSSAPRGFCRGVIKDVCDKKLNRRGFKERYGGGCKGFICKVLKRKGINQRETGSRGT